MHTGQVQAGSWSALFRRFTATNQFDGEANFMGTTPQAPATQRSIQTAQLITAMLKSGSHVSDLIFSPGRAPQIEVSGELVELKFKGLESLSAEDTKLIAYDLIGKNDHPIRKLEQDGSADLSYGLPGVARFRVNVFRQRG